MTDPFIEILGPEKSLHMGLKSPDIRSPKLRGNPEEREAEKELRRRPEIPAGPSLSGVLHARVRGTSENID